MTSKNTIVAVVFYHPWEYTEFLKVLATETLLFQDIWLLLQRKIAPRRLAESSLAKGSGSSGLFFFFFPKRPKCSKD